VSDKPDPGCPSTTRHGDRAASQHHGCTCAAARRACTRYSKQWKLAQLTGEQWLIPADGTRRRLRALYAAGWPSSVIAPKAGFTCRRSLDRLADPAMVRRATAARIAAVYAELCDWPGPSKQTAAVARALGYQPPAAWGDDIDDPEAVPWSAEPAGPDEPDPVAVARLFGSDPRPRPLAEVDARAFAAAASAANWSTERIAARVGVSTRVVRRWRNPAWSGTPEPRNCAWCAQPIPYDPEEAPWRYRQRHYHPGECRTQGDRRTRAARQAVAS